MKLLVDSGATRTSGGGRQSKVWVVSPDATVPSYRKYTCASCGRMAADADLFLIHTGEGVRCLLCGGVMIG